MLCDDIIAMLGDTRGKEFRPKASDVEIAETDMHARNITACIRTAQRFVLSPLFVETAAQLANPAVIEKTRDYLFAPARVTWLEWAGETPGGYNAGNRHGILLAGQEGAPIHLGWGAYFMDVSTPSYRRRTAPFIFSYDFPAPNRPIIKWSAYTPFEALLNPALGGVLDPDAIGRVDTRKLGAFLGAALAIINTPRISYKIEHDHPSLNKARAARKLIPALTYREVLISVDRGDIGLSHALAGTEGRALHHVRAYLRIVRGKVQLMSPHWRGNPRFGIVLHRYVALREEDEPGSWKGGPLPPPSIIDELRDDFEPDN